MESRVSSNRSGNIHKPSTPEKEVNREKKKHRGKKDCQKATDSKVYACSDTDLGKVLFHYVMFCDKANTYLSSKIYRASFGGISKDFLDLKHICALPTAF